MSPSIRDIAKMIDHSLLHPTMTDAELRAGCALALEHDVASVCIKPYAVPLAVDMLKGSGVAVGTVVGFPHGGCTSRTKLAETRQACAEGAAEIDMVINIGKALGREWAFVADEIGAVNAAAVSAGAIVKVIFENDYLDDHSIMELCSICSAAAVAFVKTSTGYGFTKRENGMYRYDGAVDRHLALMRKHTSPGIRLKAAGGIRTLDDVLRVRALGTDRIGATATEAIIAEARARGFPER